MKHNIVCLILLLFSASKALSQTCPGNIGFEAGTFNNWNCFAGTILRDGSLSLLETGEIPERHTLIKNSYPQVLDYYGGFPVNCPNGSKYSVQLGSTAAGGKAESVSYTFAIPANQNEYSILYNYAVVFQNPPHRPYEQPRFTSKVYNVTDNKYIDCGSFEFIASGSLPGFKLSQNGSNVFYKPWAPVTVNLSGLAGKTVRLEFTTNDCAFTQHFGYAYLDVDEDCGSPITGSTYCGDAESIILTAPFGFAGYSWFTADFSRLLGTDNILTLSPAPPANTTYAVVVIPYDGLGCVDTLYTRISFSPQPFKLSVLGEISGCPSGVDITAPAITAGSTPGLTYAYYTNLNQTEYVATPSQITVSGIYYIKAINTSGCSDIKPIKVIVKEPPNFIVTNPAGVCQPQKIDITAPAITAGSEPGLQLTYWMDPENSIPIPNPKAIDVSGTYYIRAIKEGSCIVIKSVDVKIGELPVLVINNPTACGKVDLTNAAVIYGSTPGINYSYWIDAAATSVLPNPNALIVSGTYYIRGSLSSGCSIIRSVSVTVNPIPDFTVTDPAAVVYPVKTVDLTSAVNKNTGLIYSYWIDSLTRKPVSNPQAVDKRGRYFIRATNEFGCFFIKPVNVFIIPPPSPIIYAPNAFTPNNDGLNDVFRIKIIGEISLNNLKIYSRWGQVVYDDNNLNRQWNGKSKGVELPTGVYVWILNGIDTYFKKPFTHKGMITLIR